MVLFVVSCCSDFWGFVLCLLFHKFRRAFFQQDLSCGKIGIVFGIIFDELVVLGCSEWFSVEVYVVGCSDWFWVEGFWVVVMIGFGFVVWGAVRFGVQGWKMGRANPNCYISRMNVYCNI